jgi:uncharacterized membrane protein YedE/YeeE
MNMPVVLSGIAVGAGFGFVLQRGKFCLNTAFRNAFYIRDLTLLRAYVLALVTALVGANILEQLGLVHLDQVRQGLAWFANGLGGCLFGIGMVLAGGDAGSTWSRAGEGLVGSWMAALGLMLGAALTANGVLAGAAEYVRMLPPATRAVSIHAALHVNKWALIGMLALAGLVFVNAGKTPFSAAQTGYSWKTAGVLVGVLAALALFISEVMAPPASGITFPRPSSALLLSVVSAQRVDWGVFLLLGMPLGAFVSARSLHEFSWRAPRAVVLVQQFGGGLLMGVGGILANGCSIGHGITGLAALSLASLVSMAGIILGCWTMVYLLFMRGSSVGTNRAGP